MLQSSVSLIYTRIGISSNILSGILYQDMSLDNVIPYPFADIIYVATTNKWKIERINVKVNLTYFLNNSSEITQRW